ncbi:MAG: Cell division coordinator CpoB [Candidatus Scalindua arabica]|uniref:Cell division coordinator CpoB n=1 Tax=Candidatus Scalindua arabica TaxID=1127984 RepID=A0A941W3W5_9BACT|nr:Cell division coordinator CpoB [Candidatus Scalindua arabica]
MQNLKSNTNPTLSLCMIVKNEEKFLPMCLESVSDYVDEIIIVDTGSTDKTVEIAERYGAKVYHHPWENSFSKARNYSLKYATCDWIMWLDADEEVDREDAHKLREVIKDDDVNVICLPLFSRFNNDKNLAVANSGKIFRNNLGFHFEGIVHNALKFSGPTKNVNIRIDHYGYNQDEEQMERKFIRTSTLLKEQIKNDPEDPKPHHYLSTAYLERKKYDESIKSALRAIELYEKHDKTSPLLSFTYYNASTAYHFKNDLKNAEKYSIKAIELNPEYLDPYDMLSIIYFTQRDYDKFSHYTQRFFELLGEIEKDPSIVMAIPYNTLNNSWLAHSRMAITHFEQNNEKKGLQSLKNAVNCADNVWKPFLAIGKHFAEHNNFKMAERFLSDGIKKYPENKDIQYYLADAYEKSGAPDKALALFKKILQNHADEIPAQYRLGLLLAKNNQHDEAISSFKSVISKEPQHTEALFNLAVSYEMAGNIAQAKDTYNNLLRINPEYPEVLIRLGALYLNEPDYIKAEECFLNTIKLDKYLLEAHLALSRIYLTLNDPESCVMSCDELLKCLALPRDITINSISDLGKLYINIGEALKAQQKELLANMSLEIASLIDPVVTDKKYSPQRRTVM